MWNKSAEAKPSSQAADTSVPVIPAPVANAQQTQPVSTPSVPPVAQVPPPVGIPTAATASNGTTTIAAGLKISGEISGTSDLYIDGETQGKVRLPNARVTVGPNGRVQADIEAREIIIEGTVQGNLKAGERLHLGAASRVQGSVLTPRFAIEDGARLRGKVEMVRIGGSQSASSVGTSTDASKAKAMSASGKDD
jgi:cytoskeletal protein CcmA (bactofilin family)